MTDLKTAKQKHGAILNALSAAAKNVAGAAAKIYDFYETGADEAMEAWLASNREATGPGRPATSYATYLAAAVGCSKSRIEQLRRFGHAQAELEKAGSPAKIEERQVRAIAPLLAQDPQEAIEVFEAVTSTAEAEEADRAARTGLKPRPSKQKAPSKELRQAAEARMHDLGLVKQTHQDPLVAVYRWRDKAIEALLELKHSLKQLDSEDREQLGFFHPIEIDVLVDRVQELERAT